MKIEFIHSVGGLDENDRRIYGTEDYAEVVCFLVYNYGENKGTKVKAYFEQDTDGYVTGYLVQELTLEQIRVKELRNLEFSYEDMAEAENDILCRLVENEYSERMWEQRENNHLREMLNKLEKDNG